MFKLEPNPSFWAEVQLPLPGGEPVAVEIEFRHLGRAAYFEWEERSTSKSVVEALSEIVLNWRGIDAAYSQENLGRLFDQFPASPRAVLRAYRRELFEARTKN